VGQEHRQYRSNQAILAKAGGGGTAGYQLYLLNSGNYQPYIGDGTHGAYFSSSTATYLADNLWHNLVMLRNGANLRLYVDGVEAGNSPANASSWEYHQLRDLMFAAQPVGNSPSVPNSSQYFKGLTDEVRISNVARSPEWVLAEYRNQSSPQLSMRWERGGDRRSHQSSSCGPEPERDHELDTAKAITLVATDFENDPLTYEIVTLPTMGIERYPS